MIEISVSAIKGGFRDLFQSGPNAPQGIASVIRPDSGSPFAVGQEAYAISFNNNGLVCTKCRIIRDVLGGSRVGNISISLLIPVGYWLSGSDIKSLLDELLEIYRANYIDDDNNLGNVYEEWDFITKISNKFRLSPDPNGSVEIFKQGTVDAAFLYYSSDEEMRKYFDLPYQETYFTYKQVFFVRSELKDSEKNPLNALRYNPEANLTGIIDPDNKVYRLREFHGQGKNGTLIEIRVKGKLLHNGDKIFKKDIINIKYYKNKCYKDISKEGSLTDSKIAQYLTVDEISRKIDVRKDVILEEEVRVFNLEIKDINGNPINEAEIKIGYRKSEKVIGNQYEFTLTGEELKENWIISAKKDDLYGLQELKLDNENQDIVLMRHKKVTFQAIESYGGGLVYDFDIQINNKGGGVYKRGKEIDFAGDDINNTFIISVTSNKYESKEEEYCPANGEDTKFIHLRKKQNNGAYTSENYTKKGNYLKVDDQKGKRSIKGKPLEEFAFSMPDYCDSRWGYKSTGWVSHSDQPIHGYNGYYEATFKELWFHKIPKWLWIVCGILVLLLAATLIIVRMLPVNPEPPQISKESITKYLQGDVLLMDSLTEYKIYCSNELTNYQKNGGLISLIGFGHNETDTLSLRKLTSVLDDINNAIYKRNLIDSCDFLHLMQLQYSPAQQKFKNAINKIEIKKYPVIKQKLKDVSAYTLSQIADSINLFLTPEEKIEEQPAPQIDEIKSKQQNGNQISNLRVKNEPSGASSGNTTPPPSNPKGTKFKTDDIKQYLRGNELDENKLNEYDKIKALPSPLKTSIGLCKDFWEFDGSGKKTYCKLRDKVKNDQNLKNSKLKSFLDRMCKEGTTPSYSKQDKIKGLK